MCKREMRRTKVLSTWIKPIVGSMVVCAGASALHAATSPVTFAQAIEASTANVFAYNDNGVGKDAELGTSTGGALGAAVPINFTYLSGAGIPLSDTDLTGVQNATISLTSSSTKAVVTGFGGTIAQQAIDNSGSLTDVIKITRTTPASEGGGSKTNLLTVTFTGHLQGPVPLGCYNCWRYRDLLFGFPQLCPGDSGRLQRRFQFMGAFDYSPDRAQC